DASLPGLEPVASVGEGTRVDHRVGVLEVGALHLCGDVDVFDALFDRPLRRSCGHALPCLGWDGGSGRARRLARACARLARMPSSLPAESARARRLTDVWPDVIAAVDGARTGWFPPARGGIVLLVDGLGARNLSAR